MGHHRLELNREEGGGWYNMYRWVGSGRTLDQHLIRFTPEEKGLPEFQAMCDQHQQDGVGNFSLALTLEL